MGYVKDSIFYNDAIQVMRYDYATYYLFDTFIVAEIDEGIVYTWDDHAAPIVAELSELYDQNGENLVLISNRVHSYSVKPSDWIKFFKSDYKLRGYAIVSYTRKGLIASLVEKLFMRNTFKSFESLEDAVAWAKMLTQHPEENAKDKSA
ncbi:hypothetical protein M0D21_00425 [Aquimarina sp. D1M17]|uniref:hypothetical protein n=1 Tax=Aquimarina acroporae TaxID=2937283 RepID=UPI0020BE1EB4|nr:hypothetical protein [Aquimarina acroporae]MCK8520014.1 hypothetical protein [Aquimarina acroporae]